jgi:predicted amidophosphoribosyltransferase
MHIHDNGTTCCTCVTALGENCHVCGEPEHAGHVRCPRCLVTYDWYRKERNRERDLEMARILAFMGQRYYNTQA